MFEELKEKEEGSKAWPTIAGVIATIAITAGWFFYDRISQERIEKEFEQDMKRTAIQMALEQERQFKLVNESGSAIDMCAHAGVVALAWLQTDNSERYKQWKEIEKKACKAAGIQR